MVSFVTEKFYMTLAFVFLMVSFFQPEKEKRKKKVRLDMHNDQRFVDNLDAYVWIYDPIPLHYWIIGTLLVLGAIGICLFPLWPPSVRYDEYFICFWFKMKLWRLKKLSYVYIFQIGCLLSQCSCGRFSSNNNCFGYFTFDNILSDMDIHSG